VNREPGRATCGKMPAPVPLAVAARADLATSARKAWVRRRGLPCSRGDSHSSRLAAQTPGRCRQNRAEAEFERRVARRNFVFALGCGRSCDAREVAEIRAALVRSMKVLVELVDTVARRLLPAERQGAVPSVLPCRRPATRPSLPVLIITGSMEKPRPASEGSTRRLLSWMGQSPGAYRWTWVRLTGMWGWRVGRVLRRCDWCGCGRGRAWSGYARG
jgi:hypothetical protein